MTIVVGYVPKPEGMAAVHAAAREARRREEDVYVVNFASGDARVDSSFASESDLESVRRVLRDAEVVHELGQHVGVKDGAEGVLRAAEAHAASLIVIGLRPRSPTGKFFFGSNAQRILLDAPCPVLTVKARP
jgi:nucleotide-binding universal stress UspA family protein